MLSGPTQCVVLESIHTPPWKVFCFSPPPPGNSSLSSKSLAFKTPLPLGISSDLLWGQYGYFLEPHNRNSHSWVLFDLGIVNSIGSDKELPCVLISFDSNRFY